MQIIFQNLLQPSSKNPKNQIKKQAKHLNRRLSQDVQTPNKQMKDAPHR